MRTTLDEINLLLAEASEPVDENEPASTPPPAPVRPRVVNLSHEELGDAIYVGRAMPGRGLTDSAFANPYRIGQDGDRAEVIQKYRSWLLGQSALLDRLHELRGCRLACWCSPEPCHAGVLAELVDADEVLDELHAAVVRVEVREGRLRLSPASSVNEALAARVRLHKPAILALLASLPPLPDATEAWRAAVDRLAEEHEIPPDVLAELKSAKVKWR